MHTLLPTLTPSWAGVLVSTTDEQAAKRLNRRTRIRTIIRGQAAQVRELHEGRRASVLISCSGHLYELEARA